MKNVCGMWNSSVNEWTFSVITSMPATPSTTMSAESAACKCAARILNECIEARSIEKIDLRLVPLGDRNGGRDGELALDFFVVEIGDRIPFIRPGQTVHSSGSIQEGGREHRFAAMSVAHDTDIADVFAFVDFQGVMPPPKVVSQSR